MTLRRYLPGFADEAVVEDRVTDAMLEAHVDEVRRARVAEARRAFLWTELDEVDLIEREGRFLVSASSDEYFVHYLGAVFSPSSANVIADRAGLYFFQTEDGDLVFLERVGEGTWSEALERRAARERRRNAPRPRPAWMDTARR